MAINSFIKKVDVYEISMMRARVGTNHNTFCTEYRITRAMYLHIITLFYYRQLDKKLFYRTEFSYFSMILRNFYFNDENFEMLEVQCTHE